MCFGDGWEIYIYIFWRRGNNGGISIGFGMFWFMLFIYLKYDFMLMILYIDLGVMV